MRIFLSLGAVFFLAPYVRYFVKRTTLPLTQEDKNFILSYTKLGWVNLLLLLVLLGLGVASYVLQYAWLGMLYRLVLYALVLLVVCSAFFVCANTQLMQWKEGVGLWHINDRLNNNDQREVLLSFLPLYNVYLRYHIHQFATPPLLLKESLVWTGSFAIISLFAPPGWLVLLFVLLYVSRVVMAVGGVKIQHSLPRPDTRYVVNIEETRGYIVGSIHAQIHVWKGSAGSASKIFAHYRQYYQSRYRFLGDFAHNHLLLIEYLCACIAVLWYIFHLTQTHYYGLSLGVQWGGLLVLVSRYVVMIPYKQFPRIPIIAEILDICMWIFRRIPFVKRIQ